MCWCLCCWLSCGVDIVVIDVLGGCNVVCCCDCLCGRCVFCFIGVHVVVGCCY